MSFPWRQRRPAPTDEEIPGLFDHAPEPGGTTSFRVYPGTWRSVTGATALGYQNILARLLSEGANPDERDADGRTALHLAVEADRRDALRMLLNADADPDAPDRAGHSPLLWAATLSNEWAVDRLTAAGARAGFAECVAQGDFPRAAALPTNADLDAPVAGRLTLLCRVVARGDFRLTRLLLERGADPNAVSPYGVTALDTAAEVSRGRILRLLLDYGADPRQARSTDPATLREWAGITG
jgi:uncharacterized protein